eukprot:TRINITY_DN8639_c0_g1_i1.p4 TRINITY_DN8639_c0_g1~~TRINITY_DN8639_c0_g1_i1.p4  ORF type:complete len:159 (-),score=34.50 TRINITY_DN8639_c0_g1_i1:341-817(-)
MKNFVFICSMFCKKAPEDSFLLERLFYVLPKKEDDRISMREFTHGLHRLCRGSNQERIHMYFAMYDVDGGGTISEVELRRLFLHSPSCLGTKRRERVRWARQCSDEVFEVAREGNPKFIQDGDISEAGFEYAVTKKPQILAAFDLGVSRKAGTDREAY